MFLFLSLTETPFATTSYFFEFFLIWSVNYANLIFNFSLDCGNVKIHKHSLYWKLCSTVIYRSTFFIICCIFSCICCSVFCMIWVNKFHSCFWHAQTYDLYLRALSIIFHGRFNSNSDTLSAFFIWSIN